MPVPRPGRGSRTATSGARGTAGGARTSVKPACHEHATGPGSNGSYLVIARASDGSLHDDQTITVTVTDVNEAPAIISSGGGATGR